MKECFFNAIDKLKEHGFEELCPSPLTWWFRKGNVIVRCSFSTLRVHATWCNKSYKTKNWYSNELIVE